METNSRSTETGIPRRAHLLLLGGIFPLMGTAELAAEGIFRGVSLLALGGILIAGLEAFTQSTDAWRGEHHLRPAEIRLLVRSVGVSVALIVLASGVVLAAGLSHAVLIMPAAASIATGALTLGLVAKSPRRRGSPGE